MNAEFSLDSSVTVQILLVKYWKYFILIRNLKKYNNYLSFSNNYKILIIEYYHFIHVGLRALDDLRSKKENFKKNKIGIAIIVSELNFKLK